MAFAQAKHSELVVANPCKRGTKAGISGYRNMYAVHSFSPF